MFIAQTNSEKTGMFFAIFSGLLYGLLGFFGMKLIESGLSVYNLTFWRFAAASLFMMFIVMYRGIQLKHTFLSYIKVTIIGALFYTAPGILFFLSSQQIGTGQSMVIFFIYPAFVMLLNWIFNKQAITARYCWSFLVILIGLILLVDVQEFSLDLLGIALSMLSALFYALYLYFSEKTQPDALSSTFLVALGCTFASFLVGIFDQSIVVPSQFDQWLHIAGIGILCSALPILFFLKATDSISTTKASLLSVLEPVFTVFFGVLLLGEEVSLLNTVGITLILVGALSISTKR